LAGRMSAAAVFLARFGAPDIVIANAGISGGCG
jgi:NAD(P)-dependent dehydrogenase (short-subunit alcohol dehydrogenase family)